MEKIFVATRLKIFKGNEDALDVHDIKESSEDEHDDQEIEAAARNARFNFGYSIQVWNYQVDYANCKKILLLFQSLKSECI